MWPSWGGSYRVWMSRMRRADRRLKIALLLGGPELRDRVREHISAEAWGQWRGHMRMVINEYRLDPTSDEANGHSQAASGGVPLRAGRASTQLRASEAGLGSVDRGGSPRGNGFYDFAEPGDLKPTPFSNGRIRRPGAGCQGGGRIIRLTPLKVPFAAALRAAGKLRGENDARDGHARGPAATDKRDGSHSADCDGHAGSRGAAPTELPQRAGAAHFVLPRRVRRCGRGGAVWYRRTLSGRVPLRGRWRFCSTLGRWCTCRKSSTNWRTVRTRMRRRLRLRLTM